MAQQTNIRNYRDLLDEKAQALRRAGREVSARALAKEVTAATGLERKEALRTAARYLAGRSPDECVAEVNRLSRRRKVVMAVLSMLGIGGLVWVFTQGVSYDYPRWFVAFLLGLAGVNLFAWALEPSARMEFCECAKCSEPRLANEKGPCPECGSKEFKTPKVSRITLWIVSAFFVGWALFFVVAAFEAERERARHITDASGWLIVAGMVVAGACGVRVDKFLRRFSQIEVDEDLEQLSRHRHLAARVLILVASVVAFTLAVFWVLKNGAPE
jgi:hypothetical protein